MSVIALAAACAVVPATALAAHPKNTGAYFTQATKGGESLSVNVSEGKISGGGANLALTKKGKRCAAPVPNGQKVFYLSFNLKKPVKPSSSGSFSISSKSTNYSGVSIPLKVSGTFTSSTKATIKAKASYKGCKGSFSTTKAKYTMGG